MSNPILPPYTRLPMKVFRKLVKKPFSTSDAFIDYKADYDTCGTKSINSYLSKWGWVSRSTTRRKMKEFDEEIQAFNKACDDYNRAVKDNTKNETTIETVNGTLGTSKLRSQETGNGTATGTPSDAHKKEPLRNNFLERTSRESNNDLRIKDKPLSKSKEHKAIPNGTILNHAYEILGHPTTSAGEDFERVRTDQVIKIDGRLKRKLVFHTGHEHIYFLRNADAKKVYTIFYQHLKQLSENNAYKVSELLVKTFKPF